MIKKMHVYIFFVHLRKYFLYICVMWNPAAALGIANRDYYRSAKLIILIF